MAIMTVLYSVDMRSIRIVSSNLLLLTPLLDEVSAFNRANRARYPTEVPI